MSFLRDVRYLASAYTLTELPPDTGAEIAFAGRSNAGKSSAINALTQRRRLAFVSKTPGRTQTINFFEFAAGRRLVDLPGYGYAAVPLAERRHWGELIAAYLQSRVSLRGLVVIVDARHPLTPLDRQLLGWHAPSGQPLLVLLTKSDKLGRGAAGQAMQTLKAELPRLHPQATAVLFSAVDGTGLRQAGGVIQSWLK